jgi:hypothetical protein
MLIGLSQIRSGVEMRVNEMSISVVKCSWVKCGEVWRNVAV